MESEKFKTVSINLRPELYRALKIYAINVDEYLGQVIRNAIKKHIGYDGE